VPPDALALGSRSEFAPSRLVTVLHQLTSGRSPAHPLACSGALTALPWSFLPFGDVRLGKRPTPGLPHPAVLRPQVFATSRRFLPPEPLGLVSCRCHPGFHLQRFSPRDSLVRLTTPSAPLAVGLHRLSTSPPQLQGFMHSRSPFLPGRCYPNAEGRSSPDVHPFEVFLSRSRRPCGCLLSWASARRRSWTEAPSRRRACSAEFQRAGE